MLFVLSDDLIPFCSAGDGPELNGLQNLLLAARQGHHALSGRHAIFSSLSKNKNLSQRERAIALSLANRRAELPLLERQIKTKIVVKAKIEHSSSLRATGMDWEVAIGSLSTKYFGALVVLAENLIDAELYREAGKHYKTSKRLNGVSICSSARGGGGSQIDVELKNILNEGIPAFAITDGDRTSPCKDQSVIAKRCDALLQNNLGIGWHISLDEREIENIIPPNVLLEVADPALGPRAHESIRAVANVQDQIGSCANKFACLKHGQTLKKAFSLATNSEGKYWLNVASAIKDQRSTKFRDCLANEQCSEEMCSCYITNGFGETVLIQVKRWLAERSTHESLRSFSNSETWMKIGARVFEASVAFKPERI